MAHEASLPGRVGKHVLLKGARLQHFMCALFSITTVALMAVLVVTLPASVLEAPYCLHARPPVFPPSTHPSNHHSCSLPIILACRHSTVCCLRSDAAAHAPRALGGTARLLGALRVTAACPFAALPRPHRGTRGRPRHPRSARGVEERHALRECGVHTAVPAWSLGMHGGENAKEEEKEKVEQ